MRVVQSCFPDSVVARSPESFPSFDFRLRAVALHLVMERPDPARVYAMAWTMIMAIKTHIDSGEPQKDFVTGPLTELQVFLRHVHELLTIDRKAIAQDIRLLDSLLNTVQFSFCNDFLSRHDHVFVASSLLERNECFHSMCGNLHGVLVSTGHDNPRIRVREMQDEVSAGMQKFDQWRRIFAADDVLRALWTPIMSAADDVSAVLRQEALMEAAINLGCRD